MLFKALPLLLLLLLALGSCSKKPGPTNAKLVVGRSLALSAGSGGVMIYMRAHNTNRLSAIHLLSNEITIPLENGNYDFRAISWDGDAPFEGNLLCGSTSTGLAGESALVEIVINQSNCKSEFFASSEFRHASPSALLPLRLISCLNLGDVITAGDLCDNSNRGISGSYRLRMISYKTYTDGTFPDLQLGLSSKCITAMAAPHSRTAPTVTLPYGHPDIKYAMAIESFTDDACAAGKQVYLFPKGLAYESSGPGKILKFTTPTDLDLYLQHGGLSISGTAAFGPLVIGTPSPKEEVFTIANFTGAKVTSLLGSIPIGFFNFKGGSYPGTGGTCSSNLEISSTCTIVITAVANTSGTHNRVMTFSYNDGESKNTGVLLTGLGQTPAVISLTPPSHAFGNVLEGTSPPPATTFTLINSGEAEATLNLASIQPPFSVVSSTCGAALAGGNSCNIVVAFSPTTAAYASEQIQFAYNTGATISTKTSSITARGVRVGPVEPFYSGRSAWNDYILNSSLTSIFDDNNTICNASSYIDCQHAGEIKKVVLPSPDFDSKNCADIVGYDSLGVFDWECAISEGAQPSYRYFRNTGFKKGKGLRDLLDADAWKPIIFQVEDLTGNLLFKSKNTTFSGNWWSNPVVNFSAYAINSYNTSTDIPLAFTMNGVTPKQNDSATSGKLHVYELNSSGAIYVVSSNLSLPGVNISAEKIALVTINDARLVSNNNNPTNNCATNGTIAVAGLPALVCTGSDFVWVEADLQNATDNTGVLIGNSRFGRVNRTSIKAGLTGLAIFSTSKRNVIRDLTVADSEEHGVQIVDASYQLLHNTRSLNSALNSGYGLYISGGTKNVLNEIYVHGASSPTGGAIGLDSTDQNTLNRVLASSNEGKSLKVTNSNANSFTHSSFINNAAGIEVSSSSFNLFSNLVIANSGSGGGIYLTGSSALNTFKRFASVHNFNNISLGAGTSNNQFSDVITGASSSIDCVNSGFTSNKIGSSPISSGGVCMGTESSSATLVGTFVGRVINDSTNTVDITGSNSEIDAAAAVDYNFDNLFRFWGERVVGNWGTMQTGTIGKCSGDCTAWDWRLKNSDSQLLKVPDFGPSPLACPSVISSPGSTADSQTPSNTFIIYAFETVGDGIGDEDGLCESNESCMYAPNRGAYQGEGAIQSACAYPGGPVPGVILRAFSTFSAPP